MRSTYLFKLQQALKVGYFTGCPFKITGLVSSQTTVKCGHGFGNHSQAGELARWGLGRDTKWCSCYAQKRLPIAKPGNHLKVSFPSILFFLVWKGTLT